MRRSLWAIPAALAALTLASPAAARDSFCSPTGDYCTSAKRISGAVFLRIGTFSFRGRVRICVTDPSAARVCRGFPLLRRPHSIYEAKVRWHGNYPNGGPGNYRVAFFYGQMRLGPVLSFRIT